MTPLNILLKMSMRSRKRGFEMENESDAKKMRYKLIAKEVLINPDSDRTLSHPIVLGPRQKIMLLVFEKERERDT